MTPILLRTTPLPARPRPTRPVQFAKFFSQCSQFFAQYFAKFFYQFLDQFGQSRIKDIEGPKPTESVGPLPFKRLWLG